jgi:AcrR family transcriptional regulator
VVRNNSVLLTQAIEDIGPRRGACRIGIADLMKEADLTVGGFYKHFKNA